MNNKQDLPCMLSVLLLIFLDCCYFSLPGAKVPHLDTRAARPAFILLLFQFPLLVSSSSFFHSFIPCSSSLLIRHCPPPPPSPTIIPLSVHALLCALVHPKRCVSPPLWSRGPELGGGGRDGWTQMEKRKTGRRGERTRRGAETTLGGLPHFAAHPERVQVVNNTWCSM